ncbi:hypothetical protein BDD12DRAFT_844582, partial [Trichophaea hybrida]
MEQRKAEIAAKRQRLAEIKRRNAERQQMSTSRRSQDVSELSAPIPRSFNFNRESIENLVRDLVGERPKSTGPTGFRGSRPNSVLSTAESATSEIPSPVISGGSGVMQESLNHSLQRISSAPVTIVPLISGRIVTLVKRRRYYHPNKKV